MGFVKAFILFALFYFAIVSCQYFKSEKTEQETAAFNNQTVVGRKTYVEFVHQVVARVNAEFSLSEGVLLLFDSIASDTVYLKVNKSCGPDAHPWNNFVDANRYARMLIARLAVAGNKHYVCLSFQDLNNVQPGVFPIISDEESEFQSRKQQIEYDETHVKLDFWETNNITAKIDTIDSLTFANALLKFEKRFRYVDYANIDVDSANRAFYFADSLNKINVDSVIAATNRKHPKSIVITDSLFTIQCSDTILKIYQDTSEAAGNSFLYLNFEDFRDNYLYLHLGGYEWVNYYVINPMTKRYAVFQDIPKFISDSIAFTSSEYYGDFFFELKGLNGSNINFYMGAGDWKIQDCFNVKSVFYFCLSRDEINLVNPIYLRLDFSKYF